MIRKPYFSGIDGLYLKSINVEHRGIDASVDVVIEGVATNNMVLSLLYDVMRFGDDKKKNLTSLRLIDQEFHCLYCTTPNPITNVSCAKCGAPRGFLIG